MSGEWQRTVGVPAVHAGVDPLDPAAEAAEGFEAFYVREYHAVVRLAYALSGSRLAAEVWRAVRALPRRQSQVIALRLRYVADASVAEIARTLGLAEGTVKAQLHRGRHALAARLAAPWEDDHV